MNADASHHLQRGTGSGVWTRGWGSGPDCDCGCGFGFGFDSLTGLGSDGPWCAASGWTRVRVWAVGNLRCGARVHIASCWTPRPALVPSRCWTPHPALVPSSRECVRDYACDVTMAEARTCLYGGGYPAVPSDGGAPPLYRGEGGYTSQHKHPRSTAAADRLPVAAVRQFPCSSPVRALQVMMACDGFRLVAAPGGRRYMNPPPPPPPPPHGARILQSPDTAGRMEGPTLVHASSRDCISRRVRHSPWGVSGRMHLHQ
jgi:hypothetical protein